MHIHIRILKEESLDLQICSMDDADFMMTAGTEHMWQEFLPETGKCPVEGMQGWHRE